MDDFAGPVRRNTVVSTPTRPTRDRDRPGQTPHDPNVDRTRSGGLGRRDLGTGSPLCLESGESRAGRDVSKGTSDGAPLPDHDGGVFLAGMW